MAENNTGLIVGGIIAGVIVIGGTIGLVIYIKNSNKATSLQLKQMELQRLALAKQQTPTIPAMNTSKKKGAGGQALAKGVGSVLQNKEFQDTIMGLVTKKSGFTGDWQKQI